LKEAEAWQSTTRVWEGVPLSADKAIDGDTNGNAHEKNCAHVDISNSYWAVAFGTPGPVKTVKIYVRSDTTGKIVT
jgi:hypothetical protein